MAVLVHKQEHGFLLVAHIWHKQRTTPTVEITSHIENDTRRYFIDPLSDNPTKWLSTQFVDKLFECVWRFCGVGA